MDSPRNPPEDPEVRMARELAEGRKRYDEKFKIVQLPGYPPALKLVADEQPEPSGRGPEVAPLVIADIVARVKMGEKKYGERLRANNGRDALLDAYQEALDLALYLRQEIEERTTPCP